MERIMPDHKRWIVECVNGKRWLRGLESLKEGALYYECTSVIYFDDVRSLYSYDIYVDGQFIGIINGGIDYLVGTRTAIFWTDSL